MPPSAETELSDVVRAAAKSGEVDRYLAALLSPRKVRGDLIALAAYVAEIRRIGHDVREAPLAEIKLQWWRDALARSETSEKSGNPIADQFAAVVSAHNLPRAKLEDWFDARVHTFYADAPASDGALALELRLLEGIPFVLAARILGAKDADEDQHMIADGSIAYGLARLGLDYPRSLARGRVPLPNSVSPADTKIYIGREARAHLARVKPAFAHATQAQKLALLPLALVEPYLHALERDDHDLSRHIGDIAPLSRVWRLWRARMTGRI
jgi:15-cis-phytoene synthase